MCIPISFPLDSNPRKAYWPRIYNLLSLLAFDCPSGLPTSSPSSLSVSSPRFGLDSGYAWVAPIDAREAMAVSSPSSAPEKKRKWLLSNRKVSAGSRPPLLTPYLSWVPFLFHLNVSWCSRTARMPSLCLLTSGWRGLDVQMPGGRRTVWISEARCACLLFVSLNSSLVPAHSVRPVACPVLVSFVLFVPPKRMISSQSAQSCSVKTEEYRFCCGKSDVSVPF